MFQVTSVRVAEGDVFRVDVERFGGVAGVGPGGGEDFVGFAAEQVGAGSLGPFAHAGGEGVVEVGDKPTAVGEATFAIFVRAAGGLHDAVHGYECADD